MVVFFINKDELKSVGVRCELVEVACAVLVFRFERDAHVSLFPPLRSPGVADAQIQLLTLLSGLHLASGDDDAVVLDVSARFVPEDSICIALEVFVHMYSCRYGTA